MVQQAKQNIIILYNGFEHNKMDTFNLLICNLRTSLKPFSTDLESDLFLIRTANQQMYYILW